MISFLFLIVLLIALIVGVPVAFAVLGSGVLGAAFSTGIKWGTIFTASLNGINSQTMMAIPLFLLAGKLMNKGGITNRLFDFATRLVGWLPGGLGHVNILSSFIFAGMSGSSVADIGCLGTVELKAMRDNGYDDDFSCGITTTSSVLGPLVPPSVPLIIYGITANDIFAFWGINGSLQKGLQIFEIYDSRKRCVDENSFILLR